MIINLQSTSSNNVEVSHLKFMQCVFFDQVNTFMQSINQVLFQRYSDRTEWRVSRTLGHIRDPEQEEEDKNLRRWLLD